MSLEAALLAAVSALSGAVVFQFAWFRSQFTIVVKKLQDCEDDRILLWQKIAEIVSAQPGGLSMLPKKKP